MNPREIPICPVLGCENEQCEPLGPLYVCDDHSPRINPSESFRDWVIRLQAEMAAQADALAAARQEAEALRVALEALEALLALVAGGRHAGDEEGCRVCAAIVAARAALSPQPQRRAEEHQFVPMSGSQDTGGVYQRCSVQGCQLPPLQHQQRRVEEE